MRRKEKQTGSFPVGKRRFEELVQSFGFKGSQTGTQKKFFLIGLNEVGERVESGEQRGSVGLVYTFDGRQSIGHLTLEIAFGTRHDRVGRFVLIDFVCFQVSPCFFRRPSDNKREICQNAQQRELLQRMMGILHVDLSQKNAKLVHVSQVVESFLYVVGIQIVITKAEVQNAGSRSNLIVGSDVSVLVGHVVDMLQDRISPLFRIDYDRIFGTGAGTNGGRSRGSR